jgi:hypothetical protein
MYICIIECILVEVCRTNGFEGDEFVVFSNTSLVSYVRKVHI